MCPGIDDIIAFSAGNLDDMGRPGHYCEALSCLDEPFDV
jgi:hypothetical protein